MDSILSRPALGMRPAAFHGVNVLSALAWAPAYLLPGMAFGASLALAGAVAARVAMLLVLLAASAWRLLSTCAFPGGHATLRMVACGFLAALVAEQFARALGRAA